MYKLSFYWDEDWESYLDEAHFSLICKKGGKMDKHFDICYEYHQTLTLEQVRKKYNRERNWIEFRDYNLHVRLISPALRLFGWDIRFEISNDLVPAKMSSDNSDYVMYIAPYLNLPDEELFYFDTPEGFQELSGCKCPDVIKRKKEMYKNIQMPDL